VIEEGIDWGVGGLFRGMFSYCGDCRCYGVIENEACEGLFLSDLQV
jgi:hypothetical protein